jgi:hypothetical protein
MWWAEMIVGTRDDLPDNLPDRFKERIGAQDHQSVLKETIHKESDFLLPSIACSYRDQNMVFFINKSDAKTLTIHLERRDKNSPVRELKASMREVMTRVEAFLKHLHNPMKRFAGEIYGAGNREIVFDHLTWPQRLVNSVKSNGMAKLYVPLATVVASLATGRKLEESLFNAGVALIALAIWVIYEVITSDRYSFSEV